MYLDGVSDSRWFSSTTVIPPRSLAETMYLRAGVSQGRGRGRRVE